ncbi:helix-turn-helix domain-containing protein [Vallitalea okinawensis]|uniref:helix-turn-helix domain-containing protein n=1 Tax=Vallitalea okinawensis TaxID=2078660 RepID=UPI00147880DA|nr:helix-turn-helix domain-containing protein [Vallitalea okinawensis]
MFIGNINLKEIQESFNMTDIMKESKQLEKDDTLLDSHHPYALEKRLNLALIEGNIEEVEKIAREYSSYPTPVLCQGNPVRSKKNNMICSCALITRVAMKAGLEEKYAYYLSDLYINKIESLEDEEALNYLNAVMLMDFMSQIKSGIVHRKTPTSPLIKNTLHYIDQHLYDDLSLTQVAEDLDVNSSYLSRIFKQEVGIPFSEYIHQSRIKKAQHLLLLTELSIVEISNKLGYTTQSHFTKIFKKICGMTPKQYKQEHVKQLSQEKDD